MDVDGQSLYLSVGTGLYRLDLNDSSATPQFVRTIPQYSRLEVLNDGSVLLGDSCLNMATALDGRWTLLVQAGCNSGTLNGLTFSPDGRRLYGVYETSSTKMRMHVYDVSNPPIGGQFPRIHDALVTGGAASDVYLSGVFVTPDGRTLMRVTKNRLYVWPIPANLQ